ncbi:MAG TPA: GGDEF domain-containing protein [Edaphobacter sp.]
MDYTTSYVFCLFCLGLFSVALLSLSLVDRTVVGTRWLAASILLDFTSTGLQQLRGYLPRWATVSLPDELSILCTLAMFLGLRWFVRRKPFRGWGWMLALALAMVVYAALSLLKIRQWSFFAFGVPMLGLLGATVWTLLRNGRERFRTAARLTAGLQVVHMLALGVRMAVSTQRSSVEEGNSWGDPVWMSTMMVIMVVGYITLMMYVVFGILEMHANVAQVAGEDALTGAMNRRSLARHAAEELKRSERMGTPLAVIGADLDHFKQLNDTYGHGGGDVALCAFVELIREHLDGTDVIARMGGEEFVLLLPGRSLADAVRVADALRRSLEQMRVHYEGRMMMTTVSMGITERRAGDSLNSLLKRADKLLYRAKAQGRNCVVVDAAQGKPVLVAV